MTSRPQLLLLLPALLALTIADPAFARPARIPAKASPVGAVTAHVGGAVSAADPRAAQAGAAMLRLGGSATDAAIATMLALGVVEPQSSGIGGGGFLVTADANGQVDTIDGREAAPHTAGPDWFVVDGQLLTHERAVPGGRSVGVPGNLQLAALAHQRHGKLPWRTVFGPAIALARDGFAMSARLNNSLALFKDIAGLSPAGRKLWFAPDGNPLPVGTVVRNPALAKLLGDIAARGPDAFYRGANARALTSAVQHSTINPAPLTEADLAAYKAQPRAALCRPYRGWRVCSMGPPSAGGIIVLQVLGMLERFDLKALGPASPEAWHLIAEAERLAFADRDRFVADPDKVAVPTAGLIADDYIAARSALIAQGTALPVAESGAPAGAQVAFAAAPPIKENGTTHFVAVDAKGGVASYTSTVESGFGSGLVVSGYVLNNELTDFNLAPDEQGKPTANRVGADKRPRSSMSPVVVFGPDGRFRMAAGAAGGFTIPPQVIRVLTGTLDWGLTAREAITLPVIVPVGDTLLVEAGTPLEGMVPALKAMGHAKVVAIPLRLKANAVESVDGTLRGAADPRSEGAAVSP
ncbi:gamma-glutamyltransferase family protein [Novosphingobium sp.]|uniref:gamma-glutamyltransferase family protein n=1 Tax=Novosphingobium sp. TaxID=1874826 RepID=UPI0038BCA46A